MNKETSYTLKSGYCAYFLKDQYVIFKMKERQFFKTSSHTTYWIKMYLVSGQCYIFTIMVV